MNKYDDIINLQWHPLNHPRMSMENRASQFAPFAALTGYKEEIIETGRITDKKIILNDEEKSFINQELLKIEENIQNKPKVLLTYFIQDKLKSGGKYLNIKNNVKRIDLDNKKIIMINNLKINFDDILKIEMIDNK